MSNINCATQPDLDFLQSNNFKFKLLNSPTVNFFCTSANIPSVSVETVAQSTRYNELHYAGDEIYYGDLSVEFKVDKNMKNYLEIFNWLTNSGHPLSLQELYNQQIEIKSFKSSTYKGEFKNGTVTSNAILYILDNNLNSLFTVNYQDCFPVSLSPINLNSNVVDPSPITATATFKYSFFTFGQFDYT